MQGQGEKGEIPYAHLVLVDQEEKKSDDCPPTAAAEQTSKRKSSCEGTGEMRVRACYVTP